MNKNKFNDWLQLGASIGVILSLIFVGLEIQQSREIAIADIYQQRTAILIDELGFGMPPEVVYSAERKLRAGEEIDTEDEVILWRSLAARLAYWENNHRQYQLGLMDEEQWRASQQSIADRARFPMFRKIWSNERETVRKSFADEVDRIVSEVAVE